MHLYRGTSDNVDRKSQGVGEKNLLGESLQFLFTENLDRMPSNIVADVLLDLQWGFRLNRPKTEPLRGVLYEPLQI